MKLKKLNDKSGSAMVLVIFIIAIITLLMFSFSTQVGNQIKSTIKSDEEIKKKYNSEAHIEKYIAKFIENIKVTLKDDIKTSGYIVDEHGNKEKIYDAKCLYYEIIYYKDDEIDVKDIDGKNMNNPIKIFIKTEPSTENPDLKDFDFDRVEDVKFKVIVTNDLKSEILITLSNIEQNGNDITYDVNYSVLSWRSK